MNRRWLNDSKLSLDVGETIGESDGMLTQPYQIYIERMDTSKKMARFYAMAITSSLFGEACLTRRWGRIGTSGQSKVHSFDREQDAVELFLNLTNQKRSRGYQVRAAIRPLQD